MTNLRVRNGKGWYQKLLINWILWLGKRMLMRRATFEWSLLEKTLGDPTAVSNSQKKLHIIYLAVRLKVADYGALQ